MHKNRKSYGQGNKKKRKKGQSELAIYFEVADATRPSKYSYILTYMGNIWAIFNLNRVAGGCVSGLGDNLKVMMGIKRPGPGPQPFQRPGREPPAKYVRSRLGRQTLIKIFI